MITSQQTLLLYEVRQTPIPEAVLIELESRLQHRIHSMVLNAFNKSGLSQRELAERLGWDEARVSRCLARASNLTLKTISALLTAIGVDLDDPTFTTFDELERRLTMPTAPARAARPPKRMSRPSAFAQMDLFVSGVMLPAMDKPHTLSPVPHRPTGEVRRVDDILPPRAHSGKIAVLAEYRARKLGENERLFIGEQRYA